MSIRSDMEKWLPHLTLFLRGALFVSMLFQATTSFADEPVDFPDDKFQKAIEEELKAPNTPPSDMLNSSGRRVNQDIIRISGVEYPSNLEELILFADANDLAGLTKLANLKKLELCGYDAMDYEVSGEELTVLPDLSELKDLTDLELTGTQIKDISALSKLTQLKRLVLDCNPIGDISAISQLRNLTTLELRHTGITDIAPLSKLRNLEHLAITEWDVDELVLTPLSNLTLLKSLEIWDTRVKDMSALSNLQNLEKIELYSNDISDISPLGKISNLKELCVTGNHISDISKLSSLSNLSILNLSSNEIKDISAIAELENLDILRLYDNPLNKDAHRVYLPQIMKKNPDVAIGCYVKTGHIVHDLKLPALCILYLALVIGISHRLRKKRRKRYILLVLCVFVLTLVPLPLRDKDIENVIGHSVRSLINDQRIIMLNGGYIPFYDSRYYNRYRKLYYQDGINADEAVYRNLGLEPSPELGSTWFPDFERCAIIHLTYDDPWDDTQSNELHFNYSHGFLAGQGYKVIIYRNIFGTFPLYIFEWVS